MLLLASCIFYMFFVPVYILILLLTIVIDYFAGLAIEPAAGARRKMILIVSIVTNIGILAFFKYYNFFIDNFNGLCDLAGWQCSAPLLNIILPIGLSFHTFQAMSYTIEVYRGNQKAERNFGIYALYVMFYPQLVAGPIERPQNILHQFYEKHDFDYDNMLIGLRLMLWGLFKKVVIADRLAVYVSELFTNYTDYSVIQVVIGVFFFTIQVYCDFSGYSDIAIGAARTMGFRLMINFNRPLFSTSITQLWRRWHISLSTWINDYLYTPLSISLRNLSKTGLILSLIISFTLVGLWHGASWNFVIYGFMNGLVLCFEALTRKWRKRLAARCPTAMYNIISSALTLSFFSFSLIFFRAETYSDAVSISKRFLFFGDNTFFFKPMATFGPLSFLIVIFACLFMFMFERKYSPDLSEIKNSSVYNTALSVFILTSIIVLGRFDQQSFIYFQF